MNAKRGIMNSASNSRKDVAEPRRTGEEGRLTDKAGVLVGRRRGSRRTSGQGLGAMRKCAARERP